MELIKEHYQWVFSGIGVFLLGLVFSFFRKKNEGDTKNQHITVDNGSKFVGRDDNSNQDKDTK